MKKILEAHEKATEKLPRLALNILQGSQNYNLDVFNENYESDYDFKAFVIPTFEELYYSRKINKTIDFDFGQVSLKDIRELPKLIEKGNPTYVELLFSKFVEVEPQNNVFKGIERETLLSEVDYNLINACLGFFKKKKNETFKRRPGNAESYDKFGYDNKSFSHAFRILLFAQNLVDWKNGEKDVSKLYRLEGKQREETTDYKTKKQDVEIVESLLNVWESEIENLFHSQKEKFKKKDRTPMLDQLKNSVFNVVKQKNSK